MSDEIKPALTPEQWDLFLAYGPLSRMGIPGYGVTGSAINCGTMGANSSHELAAMALYGQPFGFTQEEAQFLEEFDNFLVMPRKADHESLMFDAITAKIRALLPPQP